MSTQAVLFTDRRCLAHRVPFSFPERPERLEGILEDLTNRGRELRERAGEREKAEAAALRVHTEEYVTRFERAVKRGDGLLDSSDNPLCGDTWEAAWAAAQTAIAGADCIAEGEGRTAFAAIRPPGHHAERDLAMGFCFFNNVALAAEHLLEHHGLERVAIYDFDVHHGNGTQHAFESRPDVLYVSTHQYPFYPGTGAERERGRGEGEGYTLNVALPAGSDDRRHEAALEERVLPALADFRPQALLLSAGFDSWRNDPLGGMKVTEDGFHLWSRRLAELAAEVCEGRVLSVLEGGYDLEALPSLVETHLRGLEG